MSTCQGAMEPHDNCPAGELCDWDGWGECIVQEVDNQGVRELRVTRADRRTRISAHLLDQARQGKTHPAVRLHGDLFTVAGTNRTVTYQLGRRMGAHVEAERLDVAQAKSALRDLLEAQGPPPTAGPYAPNRYDRRRAQRMRRGKGRR